MFEDFLNQKVVIDTPYSTVFIGTLKEIRETSLVLSDVDIHDNSETISTKDQYIMEAAKDAIKSNRKNCTIRKDIAVSISLLSDIYTF